MVLRYVHVIANQSASMLKVGIQSYRNEDTLGAAIKASGKPRDSFFITTKLSSCLGPGETVSDALQESLARLGLGAFQLISWHIKTVDLPHQITSTST